MTLVDHKEQANNLYIFIVKKAKKLMLITLERGIPPTRFEYKRASEQYLVTEIYKAEVT